MSISGTIPPETSRLSLLTGLSLDRNSISGTILAQLGDISGLEWLNLGNTQLAYPRSSEARDEYDRATRICRRGTQMFRAERGDRSVLALSYGWLTALHPDPHGTTLAAVRRYIAADEAASDTGLFWDFAARGDAGGGDRRV